MIPNYSILKNGSIKQDVITSIQKYDGKYIQDRYNSYGELGMQMAFLRLGYLFGSIGKINSLLDVGYGNGDFLKAARQIIPQVYGSDISGYPIPEGCDFVQDFVNKEVDVLTFFDSLEHFEDLNWLKNVKAKYILVSLPNCHYFSDEWFENWKHRRPDEHIWHFNRDSLANLMAENKYLEICSSNIEDSIRKPEFDYSNILTSIFKREK